MTFAEAIQAILDGKYVARPDWLDSEYYIYLPRHPLMGDIILSSDDKYVEFKRDDLEATDWEVIVPDWETSK